MTAKLPTEITLDLDQVQAASKSEGIGFPRTRPSDLIEKGLGLIFGVVNWIWLILMLVIVSTVAMRYFVGGNTVWIEETQWHLYAVGFMIGIAAAVTYDSHIRVDILSSRFKIKTRAWIELLMILLIIFPLCWLMIHYGYIFAERAWRLNERSSNVGGLTNRWAIKGVIVMAFAIIAVASVARLMRVTAVLFGLPRPIDRV
jgi:TRAP-type mannitol/chloroaromatic compound transport system permease small subunit